MKILGATRCHAKAGHGGQCGRWTRNELGLCHLHGMATNKTTSVMESALADVSLLSEPGKVPPVSRDTSITGGSEVDVLHEVIDENIGELILLSQQMESTMKKHPSSTGVADEIIQERADRYARSVALGLAEERASKKGDLEQQSRLALLREREDEHIRELNGVTEEWRKFFFDNAEAVQRLSNDEQSGSASLALINARDSFLRDSFSENTSFESD